MTDRVSYTSAFVSFGIGAVVGVVLGVLLAPSEGRSLRHRVAQRLRKTANSARQLRAKLTRNGIGAGVGARPALRLADELP